MTKAIEPTILIEKLSEIYRGGPSGDLFLVRPLLREYIDTLKATLEKKHE